MQTFRILQIDLRTKTWAKTQIPAGVLQHYPGGRGLGAWLLYEMVPPETDALAPENCLVFTPGLLTGTSFPSSAQWSVTAKSPLTEGYGGAFLWGDFGRRLKALGYLALIVTGKAAQPTVLSLMPNRVDFLSADSLWGLDTRQTTQTLSRKGACSVACIGPAGESLSHLACIIVDRYQMGIRTGMGAVMGSKLVKAIVLPDIQGTLEEPPAFRNLTQKLTLQVGRHPASVRLQQQGKPMLIRSKNDTGEFASFNHQRCDFDEAIDALDGEAFKRYVVGRRHCHACPIGCIRETKCRDIETEGPELEPIWALGPRIGNGDLKYLIALYERCLAQGLDPIAFGGVAAFAMECCQRSLLPPDSVRWGNQADLDALFEQLLQNQGLGGQLRNGTKAYCAAYPATMPYAMQIKGVEMSGQEPRQAKAFGLALAVSNWGGDWGYGLPTLDISNNVEVTRTYFPDCYEKILDVHAEDCKGRLVKFTEEYNAICDTLGICKFACAETYALTPEDVAAGLSAFLGTSIDAVELLLMGERIVNLERLYQLRCGYTQEDDCLPRRFLEEPITVHVCSGSRLEGLTRTAQTRTLLSDLTHMKQEYYALREWPEGRPSIAMLERLGLNFLTNNGDLNIVKTKAGQGKWLQPPSKE